MPRGGGKGKEISEKCRFLGILNLVRLPWGQIFNKKKAQHNQQTLVKLIICVCSDKYKRLSSLYSGLREISHDSLVTDKASL